MSSATAVLLGAGAAAGLLGTAGGITSLVSYPALLAVGVPALPANVTNLVALVACGPGAALASRGELAGSRSLLVRALPAAAVGSVVGTVLLLATPPGVFARVVPFLVAVASLALVAQPRLTSWTAQRRSRSGGVGALLVAVTSLAVYSGYFGAGSGVLFLVLLLVLLEPVLPRANAVKNMLNAACAVSSAAVLVLAGPVDWAAVVPLGAGMFAGSLGGPVLARRVPAHVVRLGVAVLGLALAVQLWLHPG